MAELAMLADIQQTVYSEEVIRQVHIMAQPRKSLLVIDRRSKHCATPATSANGWIDVTTLCTWHTSELRHFGHSPLLT